MGFLGKLSLKQKIFGLCGFFLVFLGAVGATSYTQLGEVSQDYEQVATISVPKMEAAYKMFLDFRQVRIELRTLGIDGLPRESADIAVKRAVDAIEDFEKTNEHFLSLPADDGQKVVYEKAHAAWLKFKSVGERVLNHWKAGTPEDLKAMHEIFLKDCPESAAAYRTANTELVDYIQSHLDQRVEFARHAAKTSNTIVILLVLGSIFLGLGIGWFFAASLNKSINQVVQKISGNADAVSSASTQIAASSQELAQAATEQAASLQETAASVEELSSMVAKNAENSKLAAQTTQSSHRKANEGKQAVERMISSMGEIHSANQAIMDQINVSNTQMGEIVTVIREISEKTKVINDIVFQTKLLSFNASVEAARAGEQGKGFAVVAEEVGNLAQMSGNAAKEITEMLQASIQKVESIVVQTKAGVEGLVETGKEKVNAGVEVANQCADVLNEIVEDVEKVTQMATEISNASGEQSTGIAEINKAMSQLDAVTQQNSTATHQTSQAAESLSSQAASLTQAIGELDFLVHGTGGTSGHRSGHGGGNVVHTDFKARANTKKNAQIHGNHFESVPLHSASGFGNE